MRKKKELSALLKKNIGRKVKNPTLVYPGLRYAHKKN